MGTKETTTKVPVTWEEHIDEANYVAGLLGTYGKYVTLLVIDHPNGLYRISYDGIIRLSDLELLGKSNKATQARFARAMLQLAKLPGDSLIKWKLVSATSVGEFDLYGIGKES